MRKLFFLFIFLLFFCRYGYSENSRFYDSGQLTCNLMTTICQDARGFVWIGTEYGLNKFDGVQFTQYLNKENDATSLLGNIVRELFVDRDQRLWVGCSNGLQYYLPEKDVFCTVPFEENLTPSVAEIVQLQNGEIWLVATGRGLFKVDRENNKVVALGEINKICGTQSINHIRLTRRNGYGNDRHGAVGRRCCLIRKLPGLHIKELFLQSSNFFIFFLSDCFFCFMYFFFF